MNNWFDLRFTIFRLNTKPLVDKKSENAVLIISISYDLLIWNSLIYTWWVYTDCASLLMLQMQSIRYYIISMWSMLSIPKINATILINQSVFCMINQYFWMISQEMVRHTKNFWGSGSYSKTVRPNIFLFTDIWLTNTWPTSKMWMSRSWLVTVKRWYARNVLHVTMQGTLHSTLPQEYRQHRVICEERRVQGTHDGVWVEFTLGRVWQRTYLFLWGQGVLYYFKGKCTLQSETVLSIHDSTTNPNPTSVNENYHEYRIKGIIC